MRIQLWRRWLLATVLSGVAGNTFLAAMIGLWRGGTGAFGTSTLGVAAYELSGQGIQGAGVVIGLAIGLCQWRVLNKAGIGAPRGDWVGATVVGALLPWLPILFAVLVGGSYGGKPVTAALFGGVPGLIGGVMPGIAHAVILRRLRPRAPWRTVALWVAATVFGWGASWALEGAALGLIATSTGGSGPFIPALLVGGLLLLAGSWAVYGALTGGALIAMTRDGTAGSGAGAAPAAAAGDVPVNGGPAPAQGAAGPSLPAG